MPSENLQANGENKTKTRATTMWNVLSNVRVENAIEKGGESRLAVSDSLQPHGLYNPWNSPGQNSGVDSRSLLQGIFPTQGLSPGFLQVDSLPSESLLVHPFPSIF